MVQAARSLSWYVRAGFFVPVLLAVAGCADSPLLDRLGGGSGLPPAGTEVAAPPPEGTIRRATGEEKAFPNLATVPPRPVGVRTPAERQAMLDRLRQIRGESEAAATELDARAPGMAPQRQAGPQIPALGGEVPPPSEAIVIPPPPEAPSGAPPGPR